MATRIWRLTTNRFTTDREKPTLFQKHLSMHGIEHKQIKPYTPRHNGKVERSHRKDNERFYATHTFYSFEDFRQQLKRYNSRDYNHFPMRPLGWRSPAQALKDYRVGQCNTWLTNLHKIPWVFAECQLLLWPPRKPYVFSLVSALISRNKGKFLLFEKTVFRRIKTPGIWERNTPFTQSCMFTRREISTYVCALTKRKHIQNGPRQLQKQGRQQKPRKKSFFKER